MIITPDQLKIGDLLLVKCKLSSNKSRKIRFGLPFGERYDSFSVNQNSIVTYLGAEEVPAYNNIVYSKFLVDNKIGYTRDLFKDNFSRFYIWKLISCVSNVDYRPGL